MVVYIVVANEARRFAALSHASEPYLRSWQHRGTAHADDRQALGVNVLRECRTHYSSSR